MPIRREFITMFFSLITVVFILSVSFPLVRGDVRVLNRQRFKYVVQENEVIVSPNNPVSTKSSIQSPEQPNTVKEEVSPVKEETTLVDPDKPHLLKHIGFTYPAFVLPPPLYVSDKVPRLEDVNQYFRSLKQVSASCKEDICVHPKSYLSRYSTVDCNKTPNACEESRILVMQEPKYLVGNLDIIANGSVDRHLDCGWPADHTKSLVPRPYHDDFIYPETVVVLVVPQGLSFQHFMDGVVPKLVQLQEVIPQEPNALYVMDKSFLDPMPLKLLARLGIRESQIRDPSEMNYRNGYLRAKKLVLACQVPPLHPQLWRDAQKLFRLPWLEPGWRQQRHIVLYLSRSKGTRNAGRNVVNEGELLEAIRPLVEAKKYEFVVFDSHKYGTVDALFEFLANVDVIMGPHGGAFYNMIFMRRGTTVIEFMPRSPSFHSTAEAVHLIFYLQASLLGDKYYSVVSGGSGSNRDVDVAVVKEILKDSLWCVCL